MIILDIDDTLIDHSSAERMGAEMFGDQFSDSIPHYNNLHFVTRWHDIAEKHFANFLSGEISFQEQRRRRIRDVFNDIDLSDVRSDELFNAYLKFYEKSWSLFPDVIPFLEEHKYSIFGIISDGAHEQQLHKLRSQGIDSYFKFVITAESSGLCKPDPLMFHKACDVAGVKPSAACYIGDNVKKDSLGATNAGLRGIWLNRKSAVNPEGVECITSLAEYTPNHAIKQMGESTNVE